ncbi:hypothetical protein BM86_11795 [Bacillus thuringiensis]|uniref:Uncharacterized protein n=1 Tax=Bacillus thuringiensis TaxID=1428 RepID=A0A9W3SAS6_BACTU|nr:hypothetical protein [Bacillus thuringiensis]ANS47592.1 hypothetical protein BT246_22180 [Bacillus thuringiensis]MBH0336155.1 hypothetical protein [Bacillus thuringiensis]
MNTYLENADRLAGIVEELQKVSLELSNLTELKRVQGVAQVIEVLSHEIVEVQAELTIKGFEEKKKALVSLTTEQG